MLMRDNVSLYRKLRLLRLQVKEIQTPKAQSSGLEALAEIAEAMEETAEHKTPDPVGKKKGKGNKEKGIRAYRGEERQRNQEKDTQASREEKR